MTELILSLPIPSVRWLRLGLDEAGRDQLIAAQYDRLAAHAPELAGDSGLRETFTTTLRKLASRYQDDGTQIAAVEWDPRTGPAPQSVIEVRVLPWTGTDLAVELAEPREGDVGERSVEPAELPAGPAVRVRYVTKDGTEPDRDVVEYWLPLPDQAVAVVASCATTRLDDADRYAAIFDHLVERFSLT